MESRGPITYTESIDAAKRELAAAVTNGENLLMPTDSLNNVPPMHKVTVERIKLSPKPEDKDVYLQQGKEDDDKPDRRRYALTKEGLLKLSSCAGIQWDYNYSGRTDKQNDPNYISWRAVGAVQKLDGSWLPLQGSYDLDFDVIEEQIMEQKKSAAGRYWSNAKWWQAMSKDKQEAYIKAKAREDFLQVKRHKVARCETGAMLRAIRGLLNVRGTYSLAELQKPFVIARLVFQPDYADPIIKAQAVSLAFKAMQGVYGIQAPTFPEPRQIPGQVLDMEQTENGGYGMPGNGDEPPPDDSPPDEPQPDEPDDKLPETLAEFKVYNSVRQVEILEKLMKRKGWSESSLKKPLGEFAHQHRLEFYEKLASMEDKPQDDIPF